MVAQLDGLRSFDGKTHIASRQVLKARDKHAFPVNFAVWWRRPPARDARPQRNQQINWNTGSSCGRFSPWARCVELSNGAGQSMSRATWATGAKSTHAHRGNQNLRRSVAVPTDYRFHTFPRRSGIPCLEKCASRTLLQANMRRAGFLLRSRPQKAEVRNNR